MPELLYLSTASLAPRAGRLVFRPLNLHRARPVVSRRSQGGRSGTRGLGSSRWPSRWPRQCNPTNEQICKLNRRCGKKFHLTALICSRQTNMQHATPGKQGDAPSIPSMNSSRSANALDLACSCQTCQTVKLTQVGRHCDPGSWLAPRRSCLARRRRCKRASVYTECSVGT